jgi:glycerol-3-phosphate dehydrogenase
VAAHLYDRGYMRKDKGLELIVEFLNRRWRGQRPLLGTSHFIQYELQEAIHCGIFGLELEHLSNKMKI